MKRFLLKKNSEPISNKPEIIIKEDLTDQKDNKFLINTRIKNVGKYSLESCVEKIIETNPGIEIISIEYSPTQKELNIVTNNRITTRHWTNRYIDQSLNYINKINLKTYIDYISALEYDFPKDLASLPDLYYVVKTKKQEYEQRLRKIETNIMILDTHGIPLDSKVDRLYLLSFDEENMTLHLEFKRWKDMSSSRFFLRKEENGLVIEHECGFVFEELDKYKRLLLEYFEIQEEKKEFDKETNISIKSENTLFKLNIIKNGIEMSLPQEIFNDNFGITLANYNFGGLFLYENEFSRKILDSLDNTDDFIHKTYVRIDNCPEWSKTILYERRNNKGINKLNYSPCKKISIAEDEIGNSNDKPKQKLKKDIFKRKKH